MRPVKIHHSMQCPSPVFFFNVITWNHVYDMLIKMSESKTYSNWKTLQLNVPFSNVLYICVNFPPYLRAFFCERGGGGGREGG
jgi:hypothetical protein